MGRDPRGLVLVVGLLGYATECWLPLNHGLLGL